MSVKFYFNFKKSQKSEAMENGLYLKNEGGPTLILIHGLTGTPNEMKFLATFFHRRGYTVVCPRLANHGEPIEVLKKSKWQEFYESVRKALLSLDAPSQKGPIFVSGLSMGALLALLLAEEFPDKISGVSCLSPTLFYDGWNVPSSRHLLPLAYWTPIKHIAYFKEEPPYGIKNEAIRQRIHQYYQKADLNNLEGVAKYGYPYFPVTLFCQLRLLINYLNKRLSSIHAPVQLVQAKEDDMTSVKNSEFIYNRVSSKMKEIFLLYNSYHVITADQEREKVAQAMEAFFNRIQHPTRGESAVLVEGGAHA